MIAKKFVFLRAFRVTEGGPSYSVYEGPGPREGFSNETRVRDDQGEDLFALPGAGLSDTLLAAVVVLREQCIDHGRLPGPPEQDDPRADARALTLEAAAARLQNEVYAATSLLETLEHAGKIRGNGHHARQEAAEAVSALLTQRWILTPGKDKP